MKKIYSLVTFISFVALLLGACSSKNNVEHKEKTDVSTISSTIEKTNKENLNLESLPLVEIPMSNTDVSDFDSQVPLNTYSNEQLEYSRVRLQLMGDILNNETYTGLETLYVDKMMKGSLIDPSDTKSMTYPIEMIRLSGTRKTDGYVTYKNNENGTITVYDFPYLWDYSVTDYLNNNNISTGEYVQSIVDNGHVIDIGVSNTGKIKEIIDVMLIK